MNITQEMKDYCDTENFDVMDTANDAEILEAVRSACKKHPDNDVLERGIKFNVKLLRIYKLKDLE